MVVLLIRFVQRIEGPMSWFFPIIIGVEGFNKEERDLVKKDVVVSWYCSWNGGNCIVLSAAILQRRIALEQIGEGVPDWEDEIIEQALDVFEYLGGAVCTRMFLLFFSQSKAERLSNGTWWMRRVNTLQLGHVELNVLKWRHGTI